MLGGPGQRVGWIEEASRSGALEVPLFEWLGPLLATSVVAATAAPVTRVDNRWIRSMDFPRPQVAGLGLLAMTMLLRCHGRPARTLRAPLALALAWQAWWIVPFTRLYPKQTLKATRVEAKRRLRLLSSNIMMENRRVDLFLRRVEQEDPDVIVVLEADPWWRDRLAVLEERYPHTVQCPQANYYGMLLYSRLPLVDPDLRFLVKKDVPSLRAGVRLPCGDMVELYCLHPEPPPYEHTAQRDSELLLTGAEIRDRGRPSVAVGDLNDVAWSPVNRAFLKMSGMLDPRVGRGLYNTFDARSCVMRFPIDHVFHTRHFRLVRLEVLEPIGSDHHPVLLELSYEPEVQAEQPKPELDQETLDLTERRVDEAAERFDGNSRAQTELP